MGPSRSGKTRRRKRIPSVKAISTRESPPAAQTSLDCESYNFSSVTVLCPSYTQFFPLQREQPFPEHCRSTVAFAISHPREGACICRPKSPTCPLSEAISHPTRRVCANMGTRCSLPSTRYRLAQRRARQNVVLRRSIMPKMAMKMKILMRVITLGDRLG
jgi:hypothetical protein